MTSLFLATCVAALAGCASAAAEWERWYSGSCDARFDMPGLPESAREVTPNPHGELTLTVHRDAAVSPKFVYSCRQFPDAYFLQTGAGRVAEEVRDHELNGFDATWTPTKRTIDPVTSAATLTKTDGTRAEVRVTVVNALAQTHATLTIGMSTEIARRFVEAIEIRPKPVPQPIRVRSAECLSSIVMPGTPAGTFVSGVVTHLHTDPGTGQLYALRCVFMNESMRKRTPAELFHQSQVDTEAGGEWRARDHKDLDLDGRHAREQRYLGSDGKRQLLVRVAVDGDRLQIASFTGGLEDERVARTFLQSMRLHAPR